MGLLEKIFGNYSEKEIKKITPIVDKIMSYEDEYAALSDEALRAKTDEFKERYKNGESLDDILPEAFATVREAAYRTLGYRHFRVQLIGGIVLHQGRIAEMKTGEGKTLVATLPSYLNALTGRGVHVVTVNDYLAKRDSDWMGQVHRFLGLSVGVILNNMNNLERHMNYNCDITYGTNNEFGFDYLRDNMVVKKEHMVQRGLVFALIDEVDSVLIDEARTPLIISGSGDASTQLYEIADRFVKTLTKGRIVNEEDALNPMVKEDLIEEGDFVVDEKMKTVNLTQDGVTKAEKFFRIETLTDPENMNILHHINNALKANYQMAKDKDYVEKDGEILIVDEFTGRIMPGRRYSDGLHQAIEAKEGVKVNKESKTLATITFQNFFNKYEKKAGMTGTAQTEEQEFRNIYNMDVVQIPTNRPVIRKDLNDIVYKTERAKFKAVANDVEAAHAKGQPVLVGTISIEKSEELSSLLKKRGIPHQVLNAKYHEKEAEIVALAGQMGAVTIATNMAGRGTDIKLGEGVKEIGGLKIIGTERHESRRIDNQLRGRAGRQGDPGESKFYISLEDDLMRLFGSQNLMQMFNSLGMPEGEQIQHKMLNKAIERAQKKIESNNYGIRKNLLEYDQINNEQREIIYAERRKVLDGDDMRDTIISMIDELVEKYVNMVIGDDQGPSEWNLKELNEILIPMIPVKPVTGEGCGSKQELIQNLKEEALRLYETKEAEFPEPEQIREIERVIILKVTDSRWMDHIDDMDQLRQGIGLQAFGQRDPVVEYRLQGYDMFNDMTESIREETVKMLMHVRIEQKVEREQVAEVTGTNKDDSANAPVVRKSEKISRNAPCPCGSGKKYKYCCGR